MDRSTMGRGLLAAAVVLAFCATPLVASAYETKAPSTAVSLRLGGNWSLLTQPDDPEGHPTLLSGSAFDGRGELGGLTVHYAPDTRQDMPLEWEAGLWYGHHVAEGFEEVADSDARRTATLKTGVLRLPVLAHLRSGDEDIDVRLGLGLEALFGLYSAADVEHENTSEEAEPLETQPTTHLALTGAFGLDWRLADQWRIPLEVRGSFDPFVPTSTRKRFADFESMDDPGRYRVGFDWQVLFVTGLRYEL